MMRETAREIDQTAADWAAKVDRGLSASEQPDLDAWLAGDPRRLGAYGRMRGIGFETERAAALGPSYRPADFSAMQTPGRSRRRVLLTGGAIAASVAGLGAVGWAWFAQGRIQTKKGEVRQLALRDGSVVTLNTASLIFVNYSRRQRQVQLLRGEALFDVAHDKGRPFVVVAGPTEVLAVGTSFTVRRLLGEPVQVLVREGVVEVVRTDVAGANPLRITADMRLISSAAGSTNAATTLSAVTLPQAEVQRALAWRDGRIAFEGETLAAAAAEFSRYSDTRIVVEDQSLAREEIAGLYQANDPVGFAQSVATSLNAQTEVSESEVRIFRPSS